MMILLVLLAALAPVALFLWYIYKKDSKQPEPRKWLIKAFFFGVLSAILAIIFGVFISIFTGSSTDVEEYSGILEAFYAAFVSAAIPEETAKLLMLWLLLKKNPFFDEKIDGIVYAVCVGMGFAGLENILYLVDGIADGSWVETGISRAFFSIPGHGLFAVIMGYYYSLYHFGIDRSNKTKCLILVAPIIAHGLYDGIVFSTTCSELFGFFGSSILLYFLYKLYKHGQAKIAELSAKDAESGNTQQDTSDYEEIK